MPSTPVYALPYPAATDPADVPLDIKKLADSVEATMLLAAGPRIKVMRNAAFPLPDNGTYDLPWDNEAVAGWGDPDNMWNPAAPTVIKATKAGIYLFTAYMLWDAPAVGTSYRQAIFAQPVAGIAGVNMIQPSVVGGFTGQNISEVIPMNVNDTVVVRVSHNDSVAKNITAGSAFVTAVRIMRGSRT